MSGIIKLLSSNEFTSLYTSILPNIKYLLKTEPDLTLEDLYNKPNQIGTWDGIRNYQARNIIRSMKVNELAYFYYSNRGKEIGIYGIVEIISEPYEDKLDNKWTSIDIKYIVKFPKPLLLSDLNIYDNKKRKLSDVNKELDSNPLNNLMLFKNIRLSTQIIKSEEAKFITQLILDKINESN